MKLAAPMLRLALLASLSSACISRLEPEVGALLAADGGNHGGSASAGENGRAGNGNTGNAGNTGSSAGASAGDGAMPQAVSEAGSHGADGGEQGDVGPGPVVNCDIKDSSFQQEVSFAADIWPILTGCNCHDPNDGDPKGIEEANLVIDSYLSLRKGGKNTGANIVIDGNACDSILVQKLSQEMPPFGMRMPIDGPYLPYEVLQLISDWITEGARAN